MKLLRDHMKKQIYFRKGPYFCMQPLKWSTCKNNPSFFPPLSFPPHPFQFFSPFSSLSLTLYFSLISLLSFSPLSLVSSDKREVALINEEAALGCGGGRTVREGGNGWRRRQRIWPSGVAIVFATVGGEGGQIRRPLRPLRTLVDLAREVRWRIRHRRWPAPAKEWVAAGG